MRQIFEANGYNINDELHTVKIYDRESSPSIIPPVELILQSPFYLIEYQTPITDIVTGGIIETTVNMVVINTDNVLDGLLSNLMLGEGRYLIKIEVDGIAIWHGVLLQDFVEVDDKPDGAIQLTATDGMKLLKGKEVEKLHPTNFSSFMDYIITGLNLIPTSELYSDSQSFVLSKTDWYAFGMPTDKEPLTDAPLGITLVLLFFGQKLIKEWDTMEKM